VTGQPRYFAQSLIDPALTLAVARLRGEHGPLGLSLPERQCEAEWAFDVDFDVVCVEPPGHAGDHHARVTGNGGVEATISWGRVPATIDGEVVA
jgi:hypothetical protein